MIEYWHMCGGWMAMWKDNKGHWQPCHAQPFLSLWLLKRYYPNGIAP